MKINKKAAIAAAALLTVTGFSACGNVGEGVYGPPPETSNYEKTETDIPDTNYAPEENQNATVYGPPTEDSVETETEMPDTEYDPEDNVAPAVYGPPMDN